MWAASTEIAKVGYGGGQSKGSLLYCKLCDVCLPVCIPFSFHCA